MGAATVELLAPAGGPDSGYAALHYGADAVYLGLERFSARAEAVNFTTESLAVFAAFAHSRTPRRKAYLALNTLVKENELAGAAETLLAAVEAGVDAVITQDLGVAALVRRHFPSLELHASTQMAIHNLDGARAARDLGFTRVTLARELTLGEIEDIVAHAGLEVEVFIHGALCYSYSGLCLFSSLCTGRSGNRGRCAYPCREAVRVGDDPEWRHVFSLKDFALGPRVRELAGLGVASLKIEGRKKSPLYVAATVDYYRRILDGTLLAEDVPAAEAALQTIFARPWTRFFLDGPYNPEAADLEVVGHRGAPLGKVESVRPAAGALEVVFTANLGVELHDGIQIDIPGQSKPYGFPVDMLKRDDKGRWRKEFAVPAGTRVAVALPGDAPEPEPGFQLYLSSSQAVKRAYPYDVPKPGLFSPRMQLALDVSFRKANEENSPGGGTPSVLVAAKAVAALPEVYAAVSGSEAATAVSAESEIVCAAYPAREAAGVERVARDAFERLGDSRYRVESWAFANPEGLYVKPGALNALRRDLLAGLDAKVDERKRELTAAFAEAAIRVVRPPVSRPPREAAAWAVCADSIQYLDRFDADDFAAAREVMVGFDGFSPDAFASALDDLAGRCGGEKIRLVAPLISRFAKGKRIAAEIARLTEAGWRKWLLPNLGVWPLLNGSPCLDVVADWSMNVVNHVTVELFDRIGFTGVTFSPEDDEANLKAVLNAVQEHRTAVWIMAYGDVPYFLSAACAHSHLGLCKSRLEKDDTNICGTGNVRLAMRAGWKGEIIASGCGSVVVGDTPYAILDQVTELARCGAKLFRADFRWRRHDPEQVAAIWRQIRSSAPPRGHRGNFQRGLL